MIRWNSCQLKDVAVKITKGTTPTGKFISEGINFIKSESISYDGRINRSTFSFIDAETHNKLKRSRLQKDDILFSMAGVFLGKNAIVSEDLLPANTNQALAIIRLDKNQILPKYVHYFLRQNKVIDYVNNMSGQSAQPNINFEEIGSIDITFPDIGKQKSIVTVLNCFDQKIDLLYYQNKTLEALAETLFRQWFKEEAQDVWEKHRIEEFVEVMRGLSYKGDGLTDEFNGIPMHNLNSVFEGGGYKFEGIKYYKGEFQERHRVFPGDIIVTNTEQGHDLLLIGYPAIVPQFYGSDGIFSQHIYRLKLLSDRITNQFLYYLLMSYDVREQITGATNGSTVNMLPKDGIEWAIFKLPPKDLIIKFSENIKNMWEKKEKNYSQIRTLEKFRDTLLPKLMSGEIKVYQN